MKHGDKSLFQSSLTGFKSFGRCFLGQKSFLDAITQAVEEQNVEHKRNFSDLNKQQFSRTNICESESKSNDDSNNDEHQ